MADRGSRLRIKYGLVNDPTLSQQKDWAAEAGRLIRAGTAPEAAGRAAALHFFGRLDQVVYASEGDTIDMLLRQIEDR